MPKDQGRFEYQVSVRVVSNGEYKGKVCHDPVAKFNKLKPPTTTTNNGKGKLNPVDDYAGGDLLQDDEDEIMVDADLDEDNRSVASLGYDSDAGHGNMQHAA